MVNSARYNVPPMTQPDDKPTTLATLQKMARNGERIAMLTCYDATTARWLARGGVRTMLVGDTAGEMLLGHPSTVHTPLDFQIQITAAVKRGAPNAFVMADMPFMSYQADDAEAVRNAGRFMTEGSADAVKLEVDASYGELVGKLTRAGIPVVAHIGSRPQRVAMTGGYRSAGKTAADARRIVNEAALMQDQGAVMLLIEATAAAVSERIVESARVPVIGCGAGPACHGHVVVLHDLLGMTDWQPAFAAPQAALGQAIADAAAGWVDRVSSGAYLADDHPYKMSDEQRRAFDRE